MLRRSRPRLPSIATEVPGRLESGGRITCSAILTSSSRRTRKDTISLVCINSVPALPGCHTQARSLDELDVQARYGMSGQDAIVRASVLAYLERNRPSESCFLNCNSKDFDDPDVRERLEAFACRFFAKFDDGLRYIVSRIETGGQGPERAAKARGKRRSGRRVSRRRRCLPHIVFLSEAPHSFRHTDLAGVIPRWITPRIEQLRVRRSDPPRRAGDRLAPSRCCPTPFRRTAGTGGLAAPAQSRSTCRRS